MNEIINKYCLDSNILIQAWQKYYSPEFCPDYWEILAELGKKEIILIPEMVHEEITRTEDDLSKWLKKSEIPINKTTEEITLKIRKILEKYPRLVDSSRGRSLADPWVIAHALQQKATVVTKEERITASSSKRIKIPNVCDDIGIRWINDFQFIKELNIKFKCSLA